MEKGQKKFWGKEKAFWIIFLFYLFFALLSFNRGIFLIDEGYQVYFSWRVSGGEKIYKDFFLQVAPLSFFLDAILIKIFGLKLIVLRIYALILGIGSFFALAYLFRRILPSPYWLIPCGFLVFFSRNLFTFSHYSLESKEFLLWSMVFLVWAESSPARKNLLLFFSGIFAGMGFLSYQSFLILVGYEIFLLGWMSWKKQGFNLTNGFFYLAGLGLVGILVGGYLFKESLIQEFLSALIYSGQSKGHIFRFLGSILIPLIICWLIILYFLEKGIHKKKLWLSLLSLILFLAILVGLGIKFPGNLFWHLLSLVIPFLVYYFAGRILLKEKPARIKAGLFGFCLFIFLVGLLSGYDLGHNLASFPFFFPWLVYIVLKIKNKKTVKIVLSLLLSLFLGAGFYLYLTRFELYGEVEPLLKCRAGLNLQTARGIYTSQEKKQELEQLISEIQSRTPSQEKILIYPAQLLLYPLSERVSLSRSPFFYYEIPHLQELRRALSKAQKDKSLLVFYLKGGRIYQPLASSEAQRLIEEVAHSCREKVWFSHYLLCQL